MHAFHKNISSRVKKKSAYQGSCDPEEWSNNAENLAFASQE